MIRLAQEVDLPAIMDVVHDAVLFLRDNNIPQWQNNYPNETVLLRDIEKHTLYVFVFKEKIVAMANIACERDPQYDKIYHGEWLTQGDYAVVHRIAVKKEALGHGIAQLLLLEAETIARDHHLHSIRIDTHRLNIPMNRLVQKLGYQHCGEIELLDHNQTDYLRLAYEKLI